VAEITEGEREREREREHEEERKEKEKKLQREEKRGESTLNPFSLFPPLSLSRSLFLTPLPVKRLSRSSSLPRLEKRGNLSFDKLIS